MKNKLVLGIFLLLTLTTSSVFASMVENSRQGSPAIFAEMHPESTPQKPGTLLGFEVRFLGFCVRSGIIWVDPFGLTKVTEIIAAYLSPFSKETLWNMGAGDEYTGRMRNWGTVKSFVGLAKADLAQMCETWKTGHITTPTWTPGMSSAQDPHAWQRGVPGKTTPSEAASAYMDYLLSGSIPENLWTSSVGSFDLNATVDNVDCSCKKATIRFWLYNPMSQSSFKKFASNFPFSGQATQHMWWNWTEDYNWGGSGAPSGGSSGSGGGGW